MIAQRVAASPQVSARRGALVEQVFGTLKFWWDRGALLTRGLAGVRAERRLSALADHLRRVQQIVGVAPLLAWLQDHRRQPLPAV